MKIQDVRKKTEGDLSKLLRDLSEELREFRFSMAGGQKKNVRKGRALRHDIARVKTVLAEKAKATPEIGA